MAMFSAALVSLLLATTLPPVDTLVVCPPEFKASLSDWTAHRKKQGHTIAFVKPPQTAETLKRIVQLTSKSGQLKYVVLIGDVPSESDSPEIKGTRVPTNYVRAKVNIHWGSQPHIASDVPYADVDGDGAPDLAVGRIPADTPEELAAVVRKVIKYENKSPAAECSWRIDVVAGAGGFGALSDSLIEAAGRNVFSQIVPASYDLHHTSVKPENAKRDDVRAAVRRQLSEGGLAWIYLGHGLPLQLDRVCSPTGDDVPLMTTDDVPDLCCDAQPPLAVLIACYTGAFDASQDCLAEELALTEDGPIAVVAATRVTMPYGNTVLGYELLRACFNDRPVALGEIVQVGQRRTIQPTQADDSLRPSLDGLALGLSPKPVDLDGERREHALMYHLFGDPLLRLKYPSNPHDEPNRRD
jgi:hypothetical protein